MCKKAYILLAFFFLAFGLQAQEWEAPEKEAENVSIATFDDEFVGEGRSVYNTSCLSCHGTPAQADFTLMSPTPGDITTARFQDQKDGHLFYKIKTGRGSMPGFAEGLSDEEIWSVIAYMRSFNDKYIQPKPDMGGIEIPKLTLKMSFDRNIDQLVVKVLDEAQQPIAESGVSAYIKSMFGKYKLGTAKTNHLGIAYFPIDPTLPGDSLGQCTVHVKASKGYGSAKATELMQVAKPHISKSAIEGRHLWSTDEMAPLWLKFLFWATILSIWSTIAYVLFGLLKIKRSK